MGRKVRGRTKSAVAPAQKRAPRKHYSPAVTGPAGPRLEGQIGAQYLLPLLGVGVPRGLPHVATVTRVSFQRAASGFPMDDVIVHGLLANGQPITLELQVKRTVTFTAADKVFKDVVRLAVQASRKTEFQTQEYIVAVAVGRTSTKIEQHVQTALRWARDLQDAATFFEHLQRPGFGDKEAFEFVATFRRHMDAELGAPADHEEVWRLLRRFLVLPFDFEAPGSQAEQIVLERCAMALATPDADQAAKLWDTLVEYALLLDSTGGDATPESLKNYLGRERGYRLAGDRRWWPARLALANASHDALRDIGKTVLGLRLPRDQVLSAVRAALQGARYVEIHGAGGVGKSAVLATLAEEMMAESQVIVLAPARVPAGGWSALRDQLGGVDATARQFLTDLAGDGGGMLFIDGLDRVDEPGERATVKDLLRAAADVPGFTVVATARDEFSDPDLRSWLPADALSKLGASPAVKVGELTDAEAEALASANKALAVLLSPKHPASELVRNLFRLERLERIASVSGAGTPVSEAQMARQWWDTADGANTPSRRLTGQHLLRDLAVHALSSNAQVVPEARHDEAVALLMDKQTLRIARHGHVEFTHDVLRDWAMGCLLVDEPKHLVKLPLARPAPVALARGIDMAARMLAEGLAPAEHQQGGDAAVANAFGSLLAAVSQAEAHGSWRRCVLLAMARTERSELAINRCSEQLVANGGALLQELIGYVVAVDSEQGAEAWKLRGVELPPELHSLPLPAGRSWPSVIAWTLKNPQQVPAAAVPAVVRLYLRWGTFFVSLVRQASQAPLMVAIAAQLHTWLAQAEGPAEPDEYETGEAWAEAQRRPRLALSSAEKRELRGGCLFWATADSARTETYLRVAAGSKRRDDLCREMLGRADFTAVAAPGAMADLFIATLCADRDVPRYAEGPFGHWDTSFSPSSPARRPFLELLREAPAEGLRLVRAVCAHAIQLEKPSRHDVAVRVTLESGVREFARSTSYLWSRGNAGAVLGSALMALEAWGHERIERGDTMHDVLADVLGPDGSCAAFLAVAVDLVMTHVGKARDVASQLAGSALLLALDHTRFVMEVVRAQQDVVDQALGLGRPETPGLATKAWLQERRTRAVTLDRVLLTLGHEGPPAVRDAVRQRLQAEADELGAPEQADLTANGWADPRVMALIGLHRLEPERYTAKADGSTSYTPSDLERQLMDAGRDATWPTSVEVQLRLHSCVGSAPVDLHLLRHALDWVARADAEVRAEAAAAPMGEDHGADERRSATIAAMLVLRDGDEALQAQHGAWAHQQLLEAAGRATARDEPAKQPPYNEPAIAGLGWFASLRSENRPDLVQRLLQLAARRDVGLTNVLKIELQAGRSVDRRLGRSLMRAGLASSVFELRYQDLDDIAAEAVGGDAPDYAARLALSDERRAARQDTRMSRAVQAELDWLSEAGPEPAWPQFPSPHLVTGRRAGRPRARHVARRERDQPTSPSGEAERPSSFVVDKNVAARWLRMGEAFMLPDAPDALRALLDHFWSWTALANGVGLEDQDLADVSHYMRDGWNAAYFGLLLKASFAVGAGAEACLHRAGELAPDAFFAAAAAMLHDLDRMWLGQAAIGVNVVRDFRVGVIDRVTSTWHWDYLTRNISGNVSWPMADVIAAIYFGEFELLHRRIKCFLPPAGLAQAAAFLPELSELAVKGARSHAVACAFLSLVEVDPQPHYLPYVAKVHAAWVRAHGADRTFWEGAADRLCNWISAAIEQAAMGPSTDPATAPDHAPALITMVDQLVRVGSHDAQRLERRLGIDRPVGRG